jgi:lipopolysaccharide transport system permease protein
MVRGHGTRVTPAALFRANRMRSMNHPRVVIDAGKTGRGYLRDLWAFRGLFYFLAWRDILVRYKQTFIGLAWALLRPALIIAAFSFFGSIYETDTHGVPRVLLVAVATLPWQLFASSLSDAGGSLVANSNLITKVYFPRLIVPVSTVIVCLVDFLISLVILAGVMIYYGHVPGPEAMVLPAFVALAVVSSAGLGIFLSAMNVKYRDFRYVLPFLIQMGVFVSPIAFSSVDVYASTNVPDWLKMVYSLNPMVAVIEGFRWSLLGSSFVIGTHYLAISVAIALVSLFGGIWYFRRAEREFTDFI